jgi:hypothetical protein
MHATIMAGTDDALEMIGSPAVNYAGRCDAG